MTQSGVGGEDLKPQEGNVNDFLQIGGYIDNRAFSLASGFYRPENEDSFTKSRDFFNEEAVETYGWVHPDLIEEFHSGVGGVKRLATKKQYELVDTHERNRVLVATLASEFKLDEFYGLAKFDLMADVTSEAFKMDTFHNSLATNLLRKFSGDRELQDIIVIGLLQGAAKSHLMAQLDRLKNAAGKVNQNGDEFMIESLKQVANYHGQFHLLNKLFDSCIEKRFPGADKHRAAKMIEVVNRIGFALGVSRRNKHRLNDGYNLFHSGTISENRDQISKDISNKLLEGNFKEVYEKLRSIVIHNPFILPSQFWIYLDVTAMDVIAAESDLFKANKRTRTANSKFPSYFLSAFKQTELFVKESDRRTISVLSRDESSVTVEEVRPDYWGEGFDGRGKVIAKKIKWENIDQVAFALWAYRYLLYMPKDK